MGGGLAAGFPGSRWALAKKVVIADSLAPIADAAFAPGAEMSTMTAWAGALAYTLKIYSRTSPATRTWRSA